MVTFRINCQLCSGSNGKADRWIVYGCESCGKVRSGRMCRECFWETSHNSDDLAARFARGIRCRLCGEMIHEWIGLDDRGQKMGPQWWVRG